MASFTLELHEVIEFTGGVADVDPTTGIRKLVGGNIGLSHYPIFDEAYRDRLTGKIVDHYWNREIGTETIDQFQLHMRRHMNEIMPYYNSLYASEKIQFDPLATVDLRTLTDAQSVQDVTTEGETGAVSENKAESRSVQSETPQNMLAGNKDYATAAADVHSKQNADTTGTENTQSNSTTDNTSDTRMTGYQGIASELLMRYRESLIQIDRMIISDLNQNFMLVWDVQDTFTQNRNLYF